MVESERTRWEKEGLDGHLLFTDEGGWEGALMVVPIITGLD